MRAIRDCWLYDSGVYKYYFANDNLHAQRGKADKSSAKIRGLKEEVDRLRALAADRERLSMTAQSLEDRLKERETQVMAAV